MRLVRSISFGAAREGHRLPALLGLPGVVGIGLALLALWQTFFHLPMMRTELREQQTQLAHLRRQLNASTPQTNGTGAGIMPAGAELSERDALLVWQQLWRGLPTQAASAGLLGELASEAAHRNLQVSSVRYRGQAMKGLPSLWRQQITMPIEGRYEAVRETLDWVLRQPAMSLDAMAIRRSDPMTDQVQASLSLSVWWRLEESPAEATIAGSAR